MRIVLDMQGAQGGSRFRGIGRYAVALARALLAASSDHEFWLLLNGAMAEGEAAVRAALPAVPPERIRVVELPGPVQEVDPANAWRMRAAEKLREHALAGMAADLVLVMSPCEGIATEVVTSAGRPRPGLVTAAILYDLIPLQRPESYLANPHVQRAYLRRVQALRQTDLLLAISQSARQEAVRLLDIPEARVVTIGAGVDPFFRPAGDGAAAVLARHGLTRGVVLYAGAADPRKNLDGLLAAFALLPEGLRAAHQVALVGRMEAEERRAVAAMARRRGVAADSLVCLGYVDDEDLRLLYSACAAFVFPSLHEGFGLPALEAMACGAPTIASNTSSLPELIGRADAMFDPTRPEQIADRLRAVLEDAAFAASLRLSGMQTARQHSWEAAARRTLGAFAALERQPAPHEFRLPRPSLAFVAPLPPARSGVAGYSARLLPALARHYDITCIVDATDVDAPGIAANFPLRDAAWFAAHHTRFDRVLYQVGNSPFHRYMLPLLALCPGVVTLHDFFLSGLMAWRARLGGEPQALRDALYYSHGYPALRFAAAEGDAAAVRTYPANAVVLRQALRVLVHSRHALALARDWYGPAAADALRRIAFLASVPPAEVPARAAARARLGLAPDDFLVCAFGALHPTKLNHRLLAAWRHSPLGADPACRLAFVGAAQDDADQRRLQSLLAADGGAARVSVTGYASAAVYADYLAAADAAVQLRTGSRGETSGAMYECLEHGVPLIANAHGAASELPADAALILADMFTDAALAEALTRLRGDPAHRAALSGRAMAMVRAAHHPAVVAECYRREIEDAYATSALAREQVLLDGLARIATAVPGPGDLAACAAAISANRPAAAVPRILFDVSVLSGGGEAGAALPVLHEMLRAPMPGWRLEPVRAAASGYVHARAFTWDLLQLGPLPVADEPVEAAAGDVFLSLEGPTELAPSRLAWLRTQRRRGVRIAVVVDDPLPVLRPDWFAPAAAAAARRWLDSMIALADAVVCPSHAAMSALAAWLATQGTLPRQLGWFHPGADAPSPPVPEPGDPDLAAALAARPTLLMVGAMAPYTGHRQVLAAMEQLWQEGGRANLCIIGAPGWGMEALARQLAQHAERSRRLFWLPQAPEAVRLQACAGATALIAADEDAASLRPLIPALQHGLPIIARDLPAFRAFAAGHASYFRGAAAAALAAFLRDWLIRLERGETPDPHGLKGPGWDQAVAALLAAVLGGGEDLHASAPAASALAVAQ